MRKLSIAAIATFLAVLLAACGSSSPASSDSSGSGSGPGSTPAATAVAAPSPQTVLAAPVDASIVPSAQGDSACPGGALQDPVRGTLAGSASDKVWPTWLVRTDGTAIFVKWPKGFQIGIGPVQLIDETGKAVAVGVDVVTLNQVAWTSAAGTEKDPYIAKGMLFGKCYVQSGS